MLKTIAIVFCWILTTECYAQQPVDKSYCDRKWCKFPKNYPAHFDPYYNRHLCENFNPQQVDFSEDYFDLQIKRHAKVTDLLQQNLQYDYSSVWLSNDLQSNGILGFDYQRIQIHIDSVAKIPNKPDSYIVHGKSKVNDRLRKFSGELKLLRFLPLECEDPEFNNCGNLFGSYVFNEDPQQNSSGVFEGIMECSVHIGRNQKRVLLDESSSGADGYWNRTFIGTWTDYKTQEVKKCIWGDYRLPFVFDFMCGDGQMRACDKYVANGWKAYNDDSEFKEVGGKWELRDKWWLTD